MEDRLEEIENIERKYGGSICDVLAYRKELTQKLQGAAYTDEQIQSLAKDIVLLNHKLNNMAQLLSDKRISAAVKINRLMSGELKALGMQKSKFETLIAPLANKDSNPYCGNEDKFTEYLEDETLKKGFSLYNGNAKGTQQVEFLFSANAGEKTKPLAKIASGGEISRVMLALKCLLADKDRVGSLIFDEVDVGVGGRIAEILGKKLKELSLTHQLICITHLPQVASYAANHYIVEKQVKKDRTITLIKELDYDARVQEIARMLAGENVSQIAIKHAKEMLKT